MFRDLYLDLNLEKKNSVGESSRAGGDHMPLRSQGEMERACLIFILDVPLKILLVKSSFPKPMIVEIRSLSIPYVKALCRLLCGIPICVSRASLSIGLGILAVYSQRLIG